jgi:hypothetical protein
MKVTIEPETDAEKADPKIKPVVFQGMGALAIIGIPAETPGETALYYHAQSLPLLQQRVVELTHQLTKARLVDEAQQAQPLIQVARPNMPQFPAGNDRMR